MERLRIVSIIFIPHTLSEKNGSSSNQRLPQLLHSMCLVLLCTLFLDGESIKALYKQGCLSTLVLHTVNILNVFTNYLNDDLIPAIACLLKGTPNLTELAIRHNKYLGRKSTSALQAGFTRGYWESQDLLLLDHLEVASMELFHKGDNDLELIKYLLEHAKSLKKMIIFYSAPFPYDIRRMIDNCEKSSASEVVLSPKP